MRGFQRKILGYTLAVTIAGCTLVAPAVAAEAVHKVQVGESLWSIARQYHLDVNELARLNGIRNNDFIKPGMKLNLGQQFSKYKVKNNETLWSISKKFNISYQKLIEINHLKNPDSLRVGMEILVPQTSANTQNANSIVVPKTYKVKSGETLWSIAKKYNVDYQDLIEFNNLKNPNNLQVGMVVNLTQNFTSYQVKSGESLWSIAKKYGVSYQNLVTYNQIKSPDKINPGIVLKIPSVNSVSKTPTTSNGTNSSKILFAWPATGRLSSPFGKRWGKMHQGIDIALPVGKKVTAAASGKVIWSGWVNGYGHTVIIDNEYGYRTLYGHNSKLLVKGGDYVKQGQLIAKSGNSGRSTGPHLHFEIQKEGKAVNPLGYLQ